MRAAAAVEHALRDLRSVAPLGIEFGGRDIGDHLLERDAERHGVIDEAPAGIVEDRFGRVVLAELYAGAQRIDAAIDGLIGFEDHLLTGGQGVGALIVGVAHHLFNEDAHGSVAGILRVG